MSLDINSVLLLLARGDSSIQQVILFLLLPFTGKFLGFVFGYVYRLYERFTRENWSIIDYEATAVTSFGRLADDYSCAFKSICYHISTENKCEALREIRGILVGPKPEYALSECGDIYIGDDIFVTLSIIQLSDESSKSEERKSLTRLRLKSKVKPVTEIIKFVEMCIKKYNDHVASVNKNKIYHFIFKESVDKRLLFSKTIISDLHDETNMNFETFDHIFNEHKSTMIADLDRLKNVDYYRRNGLKRKKGYLFHGEPGCGKTYTVMAMANKSKRHIIEIPLSRIKKNEELEEILTLSEINGVSFSNDEIIILFDEIDCGAALKRENFEKKPAMKKDNCDEEIVRISELSLGTVLSRLDGIGSYNGIIFVATTNCISSLDPALYRHGRLDPYHFTYMIREDMAEMIEKAYDTKLSKEQMEFIPDRSSKLSPSTIKKYIQDYEHNLEGLLEKINQIFFL